MNFNALMVGLPQSGKTTFLAALYEFVRNSENGVGMRLEEEPAERDYFFEISQSWLKLEPLGHSNVGVPRNASLPLINADNESVTLRIPDIAGEHFMEGWEGESLPEQVVEIAPRAEGILLFVHGTLLKGPVALTPGDEQEPLQAPNRSEGPDWDPAKAPTQTILADLLESLTELAPADLPIALIVSAWDAVAKDLEIEPASWLQYKLPLLWQMLEGSSYRRPYTVFGLSAQGGNVEDPVERGELAKVAPPHLRVNVKASDGTSCDITTPLNWLLTEVSGH
jgi:double-GTPase-like protein